MADNARVCYDTRLTKDINYNGQPISTGDIVYANTSDSDFKTFGCFEITDSDVTGSTLNAQTIYTDCYDCLNNNFGTVTFNSCDSEIEDVEVPISELGYLPTAGESFYGTVDVVDKIISRITTCWLVRSIQQYPDEDKYNQKTLSSIVGATTSYGSLRDACNDCFLANATTYEVLRCNEEVSDYVLLLSGYSGNTISYTDGTNIYCGVVNAQSIGTPVLTFVSDYGNPDRGDFCEDCLATENQKILLESCTDPRNQLVVWSSTLFGIGDYSHLSTDDGCFRVVGPTDEEISSPYFLNFVPSPGCDPCIECNGIAYEYSTCSEEPTTGNVYLYQYLPSGTTYWDPYQESCTTIGNITTGRGDYALYSVNTFDDCTNCNETANIELWYGTICETGQDIYVTTVSSAGLTAGNVVKTMWGSNEYVCVELDSAASGVDSGTWYDTKKDSLGDTVLYDGCTTCISTSSIVVGLIKCDTDEESFVTISLSNYLSIIGNGFTLPNYTIRDQRQNCYTVTSTCPAPSSASTESMSVAYFFYSCQYCPDQIITSANTEYNTCVICCECGSTGSTVNSVSTPHPIYTDGYNNPIMQLNMVVLGGPNGLNS
jgi:hypothetical protein